MVLKDSIGCWSAPTHLLTSGNEKGLPGNDIVRRFCTIDKKESSLGLQEISPVHLSNIGQQWEHGTFAFTL